MLSLAALVLFWVLGGFLLRRAGLVRAEAATDLTQVVLWLTLPALLFGVLQQAPLARADLLLPALGWGMSCGFVGLGLALSRWLGLARPRAGAFILAMAFGNTTFLGYPFISVLFPAPAPHLTLAVLYDQLGTSFAAYSLGVVVASSFGRGAVAPGALALGLVKFPPLWAIALALALRGQPLPGEVMRFVHGTGALTVPLMLLSMGLALRPGGTREARGLVVLAASLKLVAMPALLWLVARALGVTGPALHTSVLEAAMPTMFYSLALAVAFGLEAPLVLDAIVLSTLLSALSLPLWHLALGR